MTNDELLALHLDNALSDAERQEFELRLQSSPELMQEAKELHTIQNMLFAPAKEDATSLAFLRGVEENIAASLLASGAAATTGAVISATSIKTGASAVAGVAAKTAASAGAVATGAAASAGSASVGIGAMWASLVASVSSSVVGASLAAASVIGSGAAVYYTVISPSSAEKTAQQTVQQQAPAPQSQALTESKHNQISQEQPSSISPSATASSAVSTTSPAEKSATTNPTTMSPAATSSDAGKTARESQSSAAEYSARISGGTSIQGRFAASIQDYTRQLQEKEAAGDRIGAALVEKSLASVLREAGQFSESRNHLQKALNAAQKLGMKELEGEVRGEQGLLLLTEGKSTQAEQALRDAVSILTSQQSRSTTRWQRELDKITSK